VERALSREVNELFAPGFTSGKVSNVIDNTGETLLNGTKLSRCARHPAGAKLDQFNKGRQSLATSVEAPMVGKILKIEKQVGDHVDEDEVVIVMEAMKMEIPIVAPVAGTLKEIMVSPGQAVEAEQALAVIE
jgi:acetyl-CoA carboxylase biotin carboxyl carrier protein